jgi:hypothetical protein
MLLRNLLLYPLFDRLDMRLARNVSGYLSVAEHIVAILQEMSELILLVVDYELAVYLLGFPLLGIVPFPSPRSHRGYRLELLDCFLGYLLTYLIECSADTVLELSEDLGHFCG